MIPIFFFLCFCFCALRQVIKTLPPPLVELPLSLLSRLLLCDPQRSVYRLGEADCSFFFAPSRDGRLAASQHQTPLPRTASSLLSDLLQLEMLWDSAVELLTLLSQVARCSPRLARLRPHLEASALHRALAHSHDPIRAAACRLLGNIDPFRPPTLRTVQPDVFNSMIDRLHDSCIPVRRGACRAVGNWLGYLAAAGRVKMGGSEAEGDTTAKAHCEPEGEMATALEQPPDEEEEGRGWTEEAGRAAVMLTALIGDPDAPTRRHCCAALGNVLRVDGAVSMLLAGNTSSLLLRAACTDSNDAVRQAAVATMCLYSEREEMRQVKTM